MEKMKNQYRSDTMRFRKDVKFLCDDEEQGFTHKCVDNDGWYCHASKNGCRKQKPNPSFKSDGIGDMDNDFNTLE